MNEGNKHLWIVYPLLTATALTAVAALAIPLAFWAFSAAGFVTILGAFMLLKEVGVLRDKSRVIVPVLFYLGLWGIHGFASEFIRHILPPALTQPAMGQRGTEGRIQP